MIRDGYKQTTEHWKQYMLTSLGVILQRKTNLIWPDTKAILTVLLSKLSWKQRSRHDKHHFNTEKIYILPDKKIKLKRTFHGQKQQHQKILLRATILKIPDFVSAIFINVILKEKTATTLRRQWNWKSIFSPVFSSKCKSQKRIMHAKSTRIQTKGTPRFFWLVPPTSQNVTSMCN